MVSQVDGIHLQLSSVDSHDLGSNWPWQRPRGLMHIMSVVSALHPDTIQSKRTVRSIDHCHSTSADT